MALVTRASAAMVSLAMANRNAPLVMSAPNVTTTPTAKTCPDTLATL